ncbi:hypothetical protein B0H14DRAFT_3643662 [Mycena olivaceomarginata]|nr:hypothetical protein B0H14DRAFT_3643662 [Mycena olivaceomarginata]
MTSRSLHIAISLPSKGVQQIPSEDLVSVADIIDLLRIKAANCVSLVIASPDTPWMSALTEGIRDVAFPSIARLSLSVCDQRNVRFGRHRPPRVLNQPSPTAIAPVNFDPATLRMDGFGISWHGLDGAKFTNLSTLALQFLDVNAAPSVHGLHMLLENTAKLEHLSVHDVHVTAVSTLDIVWAALVFHNTLAESDVLPGLRSIMESKLQFPLLMGVALQRSEVRSYVLYCRAVPFEMPVLMNEEEKSALVNTVGSVEYIDSLHKEWYM